MSVFQGLDPATVWKHFETICSIPHPSGYETEIAQYVFDEASRLGLEVKRDDTGNVVVTKPAAPGHESAPGIVLQGHLDMVGVAAQDITHDFTKDPIKCLVKGDYVVAENTTLGADNGIGAALMLALMEDNFTHGELEFLFTVNEEAGMDGAHGLTQDFVRSRRLINLDTEEWGEIYVSCAGGADSVISIPVTREPVPTGLSSVTIKITGLKGGHSGCDIHLGRGSANRIIGRILAVAMETIPFQLVSIAGGNKRNSIADNAEAELVLNNDKIDPFKKTVTSIVGTIQQELANTDPGFNTILLINNNVSGSMITQVGTRKIVNLLVALPHGVLAMSPEIEGLVETSTNIGVVESHDNDVKISMLSRSAVTSSLEAVKQQIRTIAYMVDAKVDEPKGYPGWKPNMESDLLKTSINVFEKLYGTKPAIKAIHAGLECGLFAEKLPGVEMISIGPEMHDVHSPSEKLYIPSVPKTYEFLKEILVASS